MAKKAHHKRTHLRKLFFEYGIHLWLMVFTINIAVFYVAHFYSLGKTCFTVQQVQTDNRCLYIMAGKVYQKGTRNSPHQGHPCGTDVTSVVPPSHVGNAANYLIPNYLGDICSATTAPTVKPTTPQPQPTTPVAPANVARPFSQLPSNVSLPTSVPTTAPQIPTNTLAPTMTLAPTVAPTLQPTVAPTTANPYTQVAPTAVPTAGILIGPAVSFSFALPAPSDGVAPLTPTKSVTLNIYDASLNLQDLKIAPTYTFAANATYDSKLSTGNFSMFTVQPFDMGASVSAGSYHIAFRTNQSPLTLVKSAPTDAQGTLFHFAIGSVAPETAQVQNVLMGDLNGDDKIDALDYAILIDCFGDKAKTPACHAPQAADLNNNGTVDGVDYNLLLTGIRLTSPQPQIVIKPTILPIATATPSASGSSIAKVSLPAPVAQVKKKPTPVPPKASPTTSQTMVAGDTLANVSKILTYGVLLILLGVAVFGAFKSRMFNALMHKSAPTEIPPAAAPPAADQAAAPVAETTPADAPAPPIETPATEPQPAASQQISQVFYLSNPVQDPATGQYTVTLTDGSESGTGRMTQQPPADGYYTVSGSVQEENGVPVVTILTFTPALKPGTTL